MDHLIFLGEGEGGRGGGCWKIFNAITFLSLINKAHNYFSSQKAVHDIELNKHELFSCLRVLEVFYFKIF